MYVLLTSKLIPPLIHTYIHYIHSYMCRLRRNMTDEEKEKARLEQLVLQQQVWNAEEEQLLTEALELLFISREERLTTVELADLVVVAQSI